MPSRTSSLAVPWQCCRDAGEQRLSQQHRRGRSLACPCAPGRATTPGATAVHGQHRLPTLPWLPVAQSWDAWQHGWVHEVQSNVTNKKPTQPPRDGRRHARRSPPPPDNILCMCVCANCIPYAHHAHACVLLLMAHVIIGCHFGSVSRSKTRRPMHRALCMVATQG